MVREIRVAKVIDGRCFRALFSFSRRIPTKRNAGLPVFRDPTSFVSRDCAMPSNCWLANWGSSSVSGAIRQIVSFDAVGCDSNPEARDLVIPAYSFLFSWTQAIDKALRNTR